MAVRVGTRTGGRSARVQAAVHEAVHALLETTARDALTVPMIATQAGVTPSTIYRRWGDLPALLSDVAVAHLRPDSETPDTGSLRSDLLAWSQLFVEEMASEPGMALVRDVINGHFHTAEGVAFCHVFTAGQVTRIVERAAARGEAVPSVEYVVDRIAAPVVYRLMMGAGEGVDAAYAKQLAKGCLKDWERQ